LVCIDWYKASLPNWRKTVWLTIAETDEGASDGSDRHSIKLANYLSLLHHRATNNVYQLKKYPYRRHIIKNMLIRFGTGGKLNLFKKIGSSTTHLRIEGCTFNCTDDFRKAVFHLMPNLAYLALCQNVYQENRLPEELALLNRYLPQHLKPEKVQHNLVELHVKHQKFSRRHRIVMGDKQKLPIGWMELLVCCPNLQVLVSHILMQPFISNLITNLSISNLNL